MQRAVVNPLIEFDETQHKPNQFALSAYKKQIQHKQILYSFSLSFKYNNKITSYITRNKQIMRVSWHQMIKHQTRMSHYTIKHQTHNTLLKQKHIDIETDKKKTYLNSNNVRIKIRNELRELGPVVLDSKKQAIGVPSHELEWVFLVILFLWRFTVVFTIFFERRKSWFLGWSFLLYWFKKSLHDSAVYCCCFFCSSSAIKL